MFLLIIKYLFISGRQLALKPERQMSLIYPFMYDRATSRNGQADTIGLRNPFIATAHPLCPSENLDMRYWFEHG